MNNINNDWKFEHVICLTKKSDQSVGIFVDCFRFVCFDFDVTQSSQCRTNDLNFYIWFAAKSMIFSILNVTLPFGIKCTDKRFQCLWLLCIITTEQANKWRFINWIYAMKSNVKLLPVTRLKPSVHTEQMKFVLFASVWIVTFCAHICFMPYRFLFSI